MAKKTITDVTPDVIAAWKEQHGNITKYETSDGKVAYFKEPDIAALDAAASIASTPFSSNLVIIKHCFIGGDEAVITESKYLNGLMDKTKQLINKVEGEFSTL